MTNRFKMNHSIKGLAVMGCTFLLAACASHKPVVSNTVTPALSFACERPNQTPLVYYLTMPELRNNAATYRKTLADAAQMKKPLPSDYIPFSHVVDAGYDRLEIAYWPYFNLQDGTLRMRGNITCGHRSGVTTENRSTYATGVISTPFQIPAIEQMAQAIRYQGPGGYMAIIEPETAQSSVMRMR